MPYIKINETETTSYVAFDITDNTVLIPMLYVRSIAKVDAGGDYLETDVPAAIEYDSASTFKNDMALGKATIHGIDARRFATVNSLYDKSYVMAYELLLQGMHVVIKPIKFDNKAYWKEDEEVTTGNTELTFEEYFEILHEAITEKNAFEEFKDRNLFNIKFITTGGYPNAGDIYEYEDEETKETKLFRSTMHTTITDIAQARGDAIALVELKEDIYDKDTLLAEIEKVDSVGENYKFAAAFTPWAPFTISAVSTTNEYVMPACFAYLKAFSNSVQSNANWFAASGVSRGYVPDMGVPVLNIGESLMHVLQGDPEASTNLNVCFNPIYNAGSYGYRIWGNRVMYQTSDDRKRKYQDFLNVRILLCDIRKQVFHAAMRTSFEPNDDIVWINFKTLANTLLDKMKSGRGISWYNWTKKKATDKALITATLSIKPIEAVESFDITVRLTDEDILEVEE